MSVQLPPAVIRKELRGKEDHFEKIDKLLLGLKKLGNSDEGRHYRLCMICSKFQKYVKERTDNPAKYTPDYYNFKVSLRLRELAQLIHEHIASNPTEHNFYEYLIEAWGIINQEVVFTRDPFVQYMKIALDEHAKFRATNNGELTTASLVSFCANLYEYAEAGSKLIAPGMDVLFLGPQHPKTIMVHLTRGQKEDKISPEDVKAEIRQLMIKTVACLMSEELTLDDHYSLVQALGKITAHLKAHPEQAGSFIIYFEDSSKIPADHPIAQELTMVSMRLFNARSALSKRTPYGFTDLVQRGEVNMGYQHPFVSDLRFYRNMKATLEATQKNVAALREKLRERVRQDQHDITVQIAYLKPEFEYLQKECEKLRQQLEKFPPNIEEEALECTREWLFLNEEMESLRIESFTLRTKAYEHELLNHRLTAGVEKITKFHALEQRLAATNRKESQFEQMVATYPVKIEEELRKVEAKSYQLTAQQIQKLFQEAK